MIKVITLCGSTKFKKEFLETEKKFLEDGNIVMSVCQFTNADNIPITYQEKELFDALHKLKIDLSDMIYVINKNGYIGSSTQSEIDYAMSKNKIVRYMEE